MPESSALQARIKLGYQSIHITLSRLRFPSFHRSVDLSVDLFKCLGLRLRATLHGSTWPLRIGNVDEKVSLSERCSIRFVSLSRALFAR